MKNPVDRPTGACLLCPPPQDEKPWRRADDGYTTCSRCLDRLRETLREIPALYQPLDPTPGANADGTRGAPGFGSRSPASDHVIAMRDHRSSRDAYTWLGGDGKLHKESERPPLSAYSVLDTIAWDIAENRGIDGPGANTVHHLAQWVDNQLDWATRQPNIDEVAAPLRELLAQLKPATGERRAWIGTCPNTLDEGEHTRLCAARLYAPLRGDTIRCASCSREWPRAEWLRLGDLLDAS